jgi:hypothetical protein
MSNDSDPSIEDVNIETLRFTYIVLSLRDEESAWRATPTRTHGEAEAIRKELLAEKPLYGSSMAPIAIVKRVSDLIEQEITDIREAKEWEAESDRLEADFRDRKDPVDSSAESLLN